MCSLRCWLYQSLTAGVDHSTYLDHHLKKKKRKAVSTVPFLLLPCCSHGDRQWGVLLQFVPVRSPPLSWRWFVTWPCSPVSCRVPRPCLVLSSTEPCLVFPAFQSISASRFHALEASFRMIDEACLTLPDSCLELHRGPGSRFTFCLMRVLITLTYPACFYDEVHGLFPSTPMINMREFFFLKRKKKCINHNSAFENVTRLKMRVRIYYSLIPMSFAPSAIHPSFRRVFNHGAVVCFILTALRWALCVTAACWWMTPVIEMSSYSF